MFTEKTLMIKSETYLWKKRRVRKKWMYVNSKTNKTWQTTKICLQDKRLRHSIKANAPGYHELIKKIKVLCLQEKQGVQFIIVLSSVLFVSSCFLRARFVFANLLISICIKERLLLMFQFEIWLKNSVAIIEKLLSLLLFVI